MGRAFYDLSCFDIKATLVAGAFQNVFILMVIEFTSKMGTGAGKRPALIVTVKEDEPGCDEITGSW